MQHLAFLETLDIAGFAKHKCESWKICLILHRLIWISKKIILYNIVPDNIGNNKKVHINSYKYSLYTPYRFSYKFMQIHV